MKRSAHSYTDHARKKPNWQQRRWQKPRPNASVEGMTLLEVMIAIAILGIMTIMIWEGFAQTARTKARVEQGLDHYHIVQSALERMSRELSMAYVSAQTNEAATRGTAAGASARVQTVFLGTDRGARDRVDFTSFSHHRLYRNAHESDQNELSYFLTRHPEDADIKVLARREQARIDDQPERGGTVQILVENVTEFDLEYLDPVSGEWVRRWDTTQAIGEANRLPAQVRIRLEVIDPERGRKEVFGTRAVLPIRYGLNFAAKKE